MTYQWIKDQVAVYHHYDDTFEVSFLQSKPKQQSLISISIAECFIYTQDTDSSYQLQGILVGGGSRHEPDLLACLTSAYDTELLLSAVETGDALHVKSPASVPNGPYVAHTTSIDATLAPVYKIYLDHHMAFMSGLLLNGTDGVFRYPNVNTISDSTIGIPVPPSSVARTL